MTEYPLFSEEKSVEAVNARMGDAVSPRMRAVMATVVRHLHEVVKECDLSREEWAAAIQFLTDTGQMCSDWRQEFILLSDVLGVSMLVEAINHRRPQGATENTVLGPFHVEGAPEYPNGTDIRLDGKGDPMRVQGRVADVEGHPLPGALLDVWQTNDAGYYDVQQPECQPKWNFRGRFRADADGRYAFVTARPRYYPIPDDGPVGKLLAQLGRHPNRAAHIHFIVTSPGFDPVITHIFDPDCPYLTEDAVFGVKDSLVARIEPAVDQQGWAVEWDFALIPASTLQPGPVAPSS
ncbi:intradiol ring-cleavage dioxygenase [Sphingobium sp.]|uniref:intradiol ring-cleavage dioxygenase n=1 Tax=Sphingobium sp. TaxID=1912891 RepID=UPI003BB4F3F8